MASRHIVVSGPVGVGKSTLCQALAAATGFRCLLESDGAANPFLAAAVADPQRWAFHSQAYFLTEALSQQATIAAHAGGVIQDRHLREHRDMFAAAMRDRGELTAGEFAVLRDLADAGQELVRDPDVLVYAHAPAEVILRRIRGRGRGYEQQMTVADVRAQLDRYEAFVAAWDLCGVVRVDVGELDVRTPAGAQLLAGRVRAMM